MLEHSHPPGGTRSSVLPASGLAVASVVCGILGFLTGGVTSIAAIILGFIVLSQIKKSEGARNGRRFAIAGVVTGFLSLLVCVTVVSAIFVMRRITTEAKIAQTKADFSSFGSGLEMYKLYAGVYPTTGQGLDALISKPDLVPIPTRWSQVMSKLSVDAWGNSYIYQFPGGKDPVKPEIASKGPDGIARTADDLTSQAP